MKQDQKDLSIWVRDSNEVDFGLVLHSWWMGNRNAGNNGYIPYPVYQERQASIIQKLLVRGALVKVAVDLTSPEKEIAGWICFENTETEEVVIHWIYIKQDFRRRGICHMLLKEVGIDVDKAKRTISKEIPCTKSPNGKRAILTAQQPFFCTHVSWVAGMRATGEDTRLHSKRGDWFKVRDKYEICWLPDYLPNP